MNEWRPIDTAPVGQFVLVRGANIDGEYEDEFDDPKYPKTLCSVAIFKAQPVWGERVYSSYIVSGTTVETRLAAREWRPLDVTQ